MVDLASDCCDEACVVDPCFGVDVGAVDEGLGVDEAIKEGPICPGGAPRMNLPSTNP